MEKCGDDEDEDVCMTLGIAAGKHRLIEMSAKQRHRLE